MSEGLDASVANAMLDTELGSSGAGIMPDPIYIALSTADPGATGAGFTEPGGGIAYARVSMANTVAEWPAASAGQKTNANAVTFPQATGSWGTVTHWGAYSASSGGTLLVWGAIDTPRAVENNDQCQFGPGELVVALENQS
jgi:hypothetical protein